MISTQMISPKLESKNCFRNEAYLSAQRIREISSVVKKTRQCVAFQRERLVNGFHSVPGNLNRIRSQITKVAFRSF